MFSAVHPTTDIAKILRHVRFVPCVDSHVVSQRESGCLYFFSSAACNAATAWVS